MEYRKKKNMDLNYQQGQELINQGQACDDNMKPLGYHWTEEGWIYLRHASFCQLFEQVQADAHATAVAKGFWENTEQGYNKPEKLMLIASEVFEAFEELRKGRELQPCPKTGLKNIEAELADVIIRIMDLAGREDLRIAEAICAKMEYNKTRPHKHGKLF